jgi:predicted LPLAT superfamily acyltransferase
LLIFVQVTLDRLYFARGHIAPFEVQRRGNELLAEQVRSGQGAVLLGAHLGSFEAMRASGLEEQLPLSIVGHWKNARMINALLTTLDPEFPAQVVHTGGDPVGLALTLRDKIQEGGMLAMMADRVGLNDKWVEVDFLGEKARFATGPFLLASVLKCPVYTVFGLYFEPNRYELCCEPFAERIILPRGNREAGLEKAVKQYAERLESYAQRAPNNWFNFFDFWEKPGE